MDQKRKIKRRHLIYYLRVHDKLNGELMGHLADISVDGMMIMSEKPFPAEKSFQCEMTLPEEVTGNRKMFFRARSLWSKKDVNPDFYDTGFKIEKIEEEDVALIKVLIDQFGFFD